MFIKVFTVVGIIESCLFLGGLVWAIFLWVKGIFPILLRLGNGFAKRKIAIFAKGDNLTSLKHLLADSKIFKEKNVLEITKKEDIGRATRASIYVVFWHDWADDVADILRQKPDNCALIVYAPYDLSRIPNEQMRCLDEKRNTAITNFRGRLLNDIVTSMITTSYDND